MNMTQLITGVFTGFMMLSASCGKNSFKEAEKSLATEEASKALEEKNSDKAINIILDELSPAFKNLYQGMGSSTPALITDAMFSEVSFMKNNEGRSNIPAMISILASGHAQKFGVDPLDIALKLATGQTGDSDGEGSSNAITLLYPVLPDPSDSNKSGLSHSIAILNAIEHGDLTNADFFKKSLFMMANISLITKTFDTSPADGKITLNELASLQPATTEDLFNLLETAIGALSGTDESGNLAKAAEKIRNIRQSISDQSGSDDTEKLKQFLINATQENNSSQ